MNADQLKAALQQHYDDYEKIGVTVYAILKDSTDYAPWKVDIEADASDGLKELFIRSLKETITEKDEISILQLSSSDERAEAIYQYDLDLPDELKAMNAVLQADDFPLLNLNSSNLNNIKALLIEIGNNVGQIVLYKTMAPVNVFTRASFFLKKSKNRLEKINDDFLRVSSGFQFMQINNELFVIDLKALERSFGFHDVIKKEAALGIESIAAIQLLDNIDVLTELLDDIKYARRFTKIAKSSPVLMAAVPNDSIIAFCKSFPKLSGKIRFNGAGDKIVLDTKVSKDLFIKLLMDDFLTSELTKLHYASEAKDSVEEVKEN